jgi:hypothetical protein
MDEGVIAGQNNQSSRLKKAANLQPSGGMKSEVPKDVKMEARGVTGEEGDAPE